MFKVLYEDADILAIDKPENIATIPERQNKIESVHSILCSEYGNKIFIVHRIDKDVSGVVLFAKNRNAHKNLNEQFEKRRVLKTYIGLVWGNFKMDSGEIHLPIRKYGSGRMGIDVEKGKDSLTRFKVLSNYEGYSLLELHPITGRRHQIRVHLYAAGHPLLGDRRYGRKDKQKLFSRLMLHARSITFQMRSGNSKSIVSDLPESFKSGQTSASEILSVYQSNQPVITK